MTSERIKTLLFINNFHFGGTERQFVMLSRSLDPARFETHVACIRREGDYYQDISALDLPINDYGISSLYDVGSLKARARFAGYLIRQGIQVVLAYGFYPNMFAVPAARLAGVPVVIASVRDTLDLYSRRQRWAQRQVCRLANRVVVNAAAITPLLLREGYPARQITVIRNGVDLTRFRARDDGSRLRRELGIPEGAPVVAMVSRLNFTYGVDSKGTLDFLQAVVIASKAHPQARFLLVGDGTHRLELERRAAQLGLGDRLLFTGFRSDVPELLAGVTISVLPSRKMEGLSNTVLESMAAGLPVIATRFGGTPELVEHGRTGLLVPCGRPAELAAAIGSLLDDPELAREMGEAGHRSVNERFALQRMVHETESLFETTLDETLRRRRHTPASEVSLRP